MNSMGKNLYRSCLCLRQEIPVQSLNHFFGLEMSKLKKPLDKLCITPSTIRNGNVNYKILFRRIAYVAISTLFP